jgi:hypothetical protein
MKLDRIPPQILAALGLVVACGPDDGSDTGVSGCLSPPAETVTGPCLDIAPQTSTTGSTSSSSSTGADATGADATGADSTGGTSGSGTSGTSDASDGGFETTVGPCLAPPPDGADPGDDPSTVAGTVDDVRTRVIDSGVLPPDVAARLRSKGPNRPDR